MSDSNQKIVLGNICQVTDCEHKTAPFQDEGIPMIRTPNIGKGVLLLNGVRRVSEETYRLWSRRAIPQPGDLIMAREAPVGNVAIIPPHTKVCLGQRTVLLRPDNEIIESEYLNFLLNGGYMNSLLLALSNGATVGHLNVTEIRRLSLPPLPSLAIQRKIAAVLSAYDDLIENNNKRIALLEKAAEEIYREWFVRLRFPGWETAVFHKGIPDGWDIKPMRDLVAYYIGGGWGKDENSLDFNTGAYVIRGTDLPSLQDGSFARNVFRHHKASNYKSRKLQAGDIIFEVSGGSKDQLLGRSAMMTQEILDFYEDRVICASFCKQIRIDKNIVSPVFMNYFFKLYYETGLVGIYQVQSTGISNYQFESFLSSQKVLIPTPELIEKFDNQASSLLKEKDNLALSNNLLKQTRDMLLSRLISGKLLVDDLDIQFPPSMIPEAPRKEQEPSHA